MNTFGAGRGDTLDDIEVLMLITTAHLVIPDVPSGLPLSRRISFTWRMLDPYAVQVQLGTRRSGHPEQVWVLSRELLAAGLAHSAGQGEVTIGPDPLDQSAVQVRLAAPTYHLRVHATELKEFLRETSFHVPLGQDQRWMGLDAELAALLQTP